MAQGTRINHQSKPLSVTGASRQHDETSCLQGTDSLTSRRPFQTEYLLLLLFFSLWSSSRRSFVQRPKMCDTICRGPMKSQPATWVEVAYPHRAFRGGGGEMSVLVDSLSPPTRRPRTAICSGEWVRRKLSSVVDAFLPLDHPPLTSLTLS